MFIYYNYNKFFNYNKYNINKYYYTSYMNKLFTFLCKFRCNICYDFTTFFKRTKKSNIVPENDMKTVIGYI